MVLTAEAVSEAGGAYCLLASKSKSGDLYTNHTTVTRVPHVQLIKAGKPYKKRNGFFNISGHDVVLLETTGLPGHHRMVRHGGGLY